MIGTIKRRKFRSKEYTKGVTREMARGREKQYNRFIGVYRCLIAT